VGQAETGIGEFHAFVWDPTNLIQDLGTLGGSISDAEDINNLGIAVGRSIVNPEHAVSWDVIPISPIPNLDISLSKTVDNSNPNPTDTITYTITATNNGAGAATGVVITDSLPSGVTYVSDDSEGSYDQGTGVWTVGTIPPVIPAVLTITATVDSGTEGNIITNSAQLTAVHQTDTDPTNDSDSALLVVSPVNPADKVSWWRAENNALDSVGGNDGTLQNGATFAAGQVNQAFSLDSAFNQFVRVPGSPSLEPQQLTLEAWIFPTGGSNILIASKDENTQAPGSGNFPDVSYALLGPSNSGKIQAIVDGTNGFRG